MTIPKTENNQISHEELLKSIISHSPDSPDRRLETLNELLLPQNLHIDKIEPAHFVREIVSATNPNTPLLLSAALQKNIDYIQNQQIGESTNTYPELQYYRIASHLLPHIHELEGEELINRMPLEGLIYFGEGTSKLFIDYIENIIVNPSDKMLKYKKIVMSRAREELKDAMNRNDLEEIKLKTDLYTRYLNLLYKQTTHSSESEKKLAISEILITSRFPIKVAIIDPRVTLSAINDIQKTFPVLEKSDLIPFVRKQVFESYGSSQPPLIQTDKRSELEILRKILDIFGDEDAYLKKEIQSRI